MIGQSSYLRSVVTRSATFDNNIIYELYTVADVIVLLSSRIIL